MLNKSHPWWLEGLAEAERYVSPFVAEADVEAEEGVAFELESQAGAGCEFPVGVFEIFDFVGHGAVVGEQNESQAFDADAAQYMEWEAALQQDGAVFD